MMAVEPTVYDRLRDAFIVAVPTLVFGLLFGGWRERRKYHAAVFNKEEAEAYELVRGHFITIREQSAHDAYIFSQSETDNPPSFSREDLEAIDRRRAASSAAVKELRAILFVRTRELSPAAYNVIKDFLDWHDSDERSDGNGQFGEGDWGSSRYLVDFTERRLVDLGAMWSLTWRVRRAKRAITSKLDLWRFRVRSWRGARLRRKRLEKQKADTLAGRPVTSAGSRSGRNAQRPQR